MNSKHPLYFCIHGHFYQPPRENPWTGTIENQSSAAPYHDWNQRIASECYAPNSASRILDEHGRIAGMVNNYEFMSFNIGPTLMSWIREFRPNTYRRIQEADRKSAERLNGHGNAIAQVYNHIIMPLASRRDRLTQIRWGIQDFEKHFGRKPEAMWLAETAINMDTIVDLIQEGIRFTILSPTQAESIRALGEKHESAQWEVFEDTNIDTTRPYRIFPRDAQGKKLCEGYLDVFFYHPWLSSAVGFEHLLRDSHTFGKRIQEAWDPKKNEPQLISIGTDGESYGHHEAYGDMCAAWMFKHFAPEHQMIPVNYAWYLEQFPPKHEVRLKNMKGEGCAWSCAHGVGRWYRDCGCHTGGPEDWNQKWRGPLRQSLDHLKATADKIFESELSLLLREGLDPWTMRDQYIQVLLNPKDNGERLALLHRFLQHPERPYDQAQAMRLLEVQKFCLFSYTSCGWFFNDLEGIEPIQNLRYALRAMELLQPYLGWGETIQSSFLGILARAKGNQSGRNGAEIFVEEVKPKVAAWLRYLGEVAVRMHLHMDQEHVWNLDLFQIQLQDKQMDPQRSLLSFRLEQQETQEEFFASVRVTSDNLGRIQLVILQGVDSWQQLQHLHPDLKPQQILDRIPRSSSLRLKDLFTDALQRINQQAAEKSLMRISEEFQDFAQRHHLSLDCLADPTNSLPEAVRESLAVALISDIHRNALQALEHVDDAVLKQVQELVEEANTLHVKIPTGGLGTLFHQRLCDLISLVVRTPDVQQVRQITGLITLADSMHLDIDKTSLENRAFESYQNWISGHDPEWNLLSEMYEWLNFAHTLTNLPENQSSAKKAT